MHCAVALSLAMSVKPDVKLPDLRYVSPAASDARAALERERAVAFVAHEEEAERARRVFEDAGSSDERSRDAAAPADAARCRAASRRRGASKGGGREVRRAGREVLLRGDSAVSAQS